MSLPKNVTTYACGCKEYRHEGEAFPSVSVICHFHSWSMGVDYVWRWNADPEGYVCDCCDSRRHPAFGWGDNPMQGCFT